MPLAPPADVQDGTRFALAVMVTGVGAVAEKGTEAGIGAAAPLKMSESVYIPCEPNRSKHTKKQ
eukprot:COSAG02_NODE_7006_length_3229_cov_41.784026_3_plen_64_part_00